MVVRVTCTKREDEGAVTGTTHERRYEDRPQKSSAPRGTRRSAWRLRRLSRSGPSEPLRPPRHLQPRLAAQLVAQSMAGRAHLCIDEQAPLGEQVVIVGQLVGPLKFN